MNQNVLLQDFSENIRTRHSLNGLFISTLTRGGPRLNEHEPVETRSYICFSPRLGKRSSAAASFSAPIFNTAMRPLIMQGFK